MALSIPTMQQPEAYIGNAATLFGESGNLASDSIKAFATRFMSTFAAWVENNTASRKQ